MNGHEDHSLAEAISHLAREIGAVREDRKIEFNWLRSLIVLATKHDLKETEHHIMSAISEYAAKAAAFNERMDTAITDLQGDVQTLNDTITALQNSPGSVSQEDQASLDALQARAESITAKLEALDALTPPPPPVG